MVSQNNARKPTKFYQEDIVQRTEAPHSYGIVLRCWHDAEDVPPLTEQYDPLMRPLQRGEIGVSFFPNAIREILPESGFTLVDRMFQPGDLCKKSIDDVRSGVVTGVDVKARLEHAISGAPVPGWKSMSDVESPADVDVGDYVAYDHWVGQIVELFDEAVVDISNGQLVRLPELSSRLTVGDKGSDILPSPVNFGSLFGLFSRASRQNSADTVVEIKHSVLAISWLAIDQSLSPEVAETKPRPSRFWPSGELGKLKLVRSRAEQLMRVGDKVVLKDSTGLPFTSHGTDGEPYGVVEVRVYVVKTTQTTVNVLWQDGSTETLLATDLIPYLNPDEYDCWPGDHVIWKGEDTKRAAVVQSVDSAQRTALIRYGDTGTTELASLLELDPHGTSDWSAVEPVTFDGLGVRRGDFVFIHSPGSTNGLEKPRVPRIGEVEAWVREPPTVGANGQYGGWRKTISDIGMDIAQRREQDSIAEGKIRRPDKKDNSLNWFGEVSELRLDGSVEVTLPNGSISILPLERLTRLYDTLEQLEDLWGDDLSAEQDEMDDVDDLHHHHHHYHHHHHHHGPDEIWAMDEDGHWQAEANGEDGEEWEETDDEDETMEVEEEDWTDDSSTPEQADADAKWMDTLTPSSEPGAGEPVEPPDSTALSQVTASTVYSSSSDVAKEAMDETEAVTAQATVPKTEDVNPSWKRFEVLAEAPHDHAFYSSTPAQPSRNFLGRLQKEYRALTNSLPDSIVVRAYEDRSDLLRSLIIGPENTPYEDAPFVIDWMLDSNFPQSPPIAHFLSWTNGNGRVNPNLYEEGKVCLSILGTWAGDRSESWSPARSSLLQALVSIQGLVLVKEPWFCEPAYDKLRGTEDGIVNSRLYNEKAYVLSRGFVRRALEIPLGSLETEIHWLYYQQGRLAKVVQDARALIEKSRAEPEITEASSDREQRAVPRLTAGGIITLERTLVKLEALLRQAPPAPVATDS
ncbi:hypothetical protein EVG20_g2080 [Dentipellis fragilis]|uniref:UBC core domain-containing protein n=1 Tax=Dentipellis fragilis TaxID=205917 RepID=A0A4Y9Z7R8_9AGAM|nr:hypothetical protein EVG20_g2080 [Dentipellis fragilis]